MSANSQLELAATAESVPLARAAITDLCTRLSLDDDLIERVRLATTEASTNCVLHPQQRQRRELDFVLEARLEDRELVVVVRDSGTGISQAADSERAGSHAEVTSAIHALTQARSASPRQYPSRVR